MNELPEIIACHAEKIIRLVRDIATTADGMRALLKYQKKKSGPTPFVKEFLTPVRERHDARLERQGGSSTSNLRYISKIIILILYLHAVHKKFLVQ